MYSLTSLLSRNGDIILCIEKLSHKVKDSDFTLSKRFRWSKVIGAKKALFHEMILSNIAEKTKEI